MESFNHGFMQTFAKPTIITCVLLYITITGILTSFAVGCFEYFNKQLLTLRLQFLKREGNK